MAAEDVSAGEIPAEGEVQLPTDREPVAADDSPIEVDVQGDGDDPGLLEQVADAVGDLWNDTKDMVT